MISSVSLSTRPWNLGSVEGKWEQEENYMRIMRAEGIDSILCLPLLGGASAGYGRRGGRRRKRRKSSRDKRGCNRSSLPRLEHHRVLCGGRMSSDRPRDTADQRSIASDISLSARRRLEEIRRNWSDALIILNRICICIYS